MTSNEILLSYKGDANKEVLSSMLDIIEVKLDTTNVSSKLKKKLYNILVECLQNLYHHIDESVEKDSIKGIIANSAAIFMFSKSESSFNICTGNYIDSNDVEKLRERITYINSMGKDELKAYHKQILNNGEISIKGGGGLGLIDMVRKSENKLGYCFQKVNKNMYFFTLEIKLSIH